MPFHGSQAVLGRAIIGFHPHGLSAEVEVRPARTYISTKKRIPSGLRQAAVKGSFSLAQTPSSSHKMAIAFSITRSVRGALARILHEHEPGHRQLRQASDNIGTEEPRQHPLQVREVVQGQGFADAIDLHAPGLDEGA